MISKFKGKYRKLLAYIRHPFGITCLACGFLAVDRQELTPSERISLYCRCSAGGCPPLDEIRCFRSLWVDLDLTYSYPYPLEEVLDEVNRSHRGCKGFFKHKPGSSPSGHQELL